MRKKLGLAEALNFKARRIRRGIERHDEILEESAPAENGGDGQLIGKTSLDSDDVRSNVQCNIVMVDRNSCTPHDAANLRRGALLNPNADGLSNISVEVAIGSTGIDQRLKSSAWRRVSNRIADSDFQNRHPDRCLLWKCRVRRLDGNNLVGKFHSLGARLQDAVNPILWHSNQNRIGFTVSFGRLSGFLERLAFSNDTTFIGRKSQPVIRRCTTQDVESSFGAHETDSRTAQDRCPGLDVFTAKDKRKLDW